MSTNLNLINFSVTIIFAMRLSVRFVECIFWLSTVLEWVLYLKSVFDKLYVYGE